MSQWQSWDKNWNLQSPEPVFYPLVHIAGLGHCLLHEDLLLLQVFYRSLSSGLVSTLLYCVQAESSRKKKASLPASPMEYLEGPPKNPPREFRKLAELTYMPSLQEILLVSQTKGHLHYGERWQNVDLRLSESYL